MQHDIGSIVSAAVVLHEKSSYDYHDYVIDKKVHKIPKIDKNTKYPEFIKSLLKK